MTNEDFDEFLIASRPQGYSHETRQTLSLITKEATNPEEAVRQLLPKVIAKKLQTLVPEGFELSEITITGEFSGMPFGIGVGGQISVTYSKSKQSREG